MSAARELEIAEDLLDTLENQFGTAHFEAGGEIYKAEAALVALIVKLKDVAVRKP